MNDVAKIIGWDYEYEGHEGAVDGLLTWLRQHNFTSFHFGCQGDGYYVDWGYDAVHGPTLLATLEAAVRKIASA